MRAAKQGVRSRAQGRAWALAGAGAAVLAAGVLMGSNIGYPLLLLPRLSGMFDRPAFYALGTSLSLLTLGYMWMLSRAQSGAGAKAKAKEPVMSGASTHPAVVHG